MASFFLISGLPALVGWKATTGVFGAMQPSVGKARMRKNGTALCSDAVSAMTCSMSGAGMSADTNGTTSKVEPNQQSFLPKTKKSHCVDLAPSCTSVFELYCRHLCT